MKCKKGQKGLAAIKLDMEKAYDRLEWKFILHILMIEQCISIVSFSILINGSPYEFFRPQRGLRQGDPLSPLLFIIAAEVLSHLIKRVEVLGLLQGIKVARHAPSISHLMLASDLLVFCRANGREAMALAKSLADIPSGQDNVLIH